MSKAILIFWTCLALATAGAVSARADAFWGAGASTCGNWIEARKSSSRFEEDALYSWAQGYISAVDGMNDHIISSKRHDLNGLDILLDNYCKAHQSDPFGGAVVMVIPELLNEGNKP